MGMMYKYIVRTFSSKGTQSRLVMSPAADDKTVLTISTKFKNSCGTRKTVLHAFASLQSGSRGLVVRSCSSACKRTSLADAT